MSFHEMTKRIFDALSSFLALILLAPLFGVIMVIVHLETRGGAFFRQERVGKNGRAFRLLKFRSMHKNAAGPLITLGKEDKRITRSGRWLRQSKLDELPQLWNILVGDMSIVGPRPEVPKYVALYNDEMLKVLAVRPGLTDPASIEAFEEGNELALSENPEEHYRTVILPRKVSAQLVYLQNSSLLSDGRVIARTFLRIFKG
jgi:lipopolysaccharide/colanic/teichoic acid biosynthesis glycosyltransferase